MLIFFKKILSISSKPPISIRGSLFPGGYVSVRLHCTDNEQFSSMHTFTKEYLQGMEAAVKSTTWEKMISESVTINADDLKNLHAAIVTPLKLSAYSHDNSNNLEYREKGHVGGYFLDPWSCSKKGYVEIEKLITDKPTPISNICKIIKDTNDKSGLVSTSDGNLAEHVNTYLQTTQESLTSKTDTDEKIELIATLCRNILVLHPFHDGNGRVSMMLMHALLQKSGIEPTILSTPAVLGRSIDEITGAIKEGQITFKMWNNILERRTLKFTTIKNSIPHSVISIPQFTSQNDSLSKKVLPLSPAEKNFIIRQICQGNAQINYHDWDHSITKEGFRTVKPTWYKTFQAIKKLVTNFNDIGKEEKHMLWDFLNVSIKKAVTTSRYKGTTEQDLKIEIQKALGQNTPGT